MPRVTQHTKNKGGKTEEYRCQRCSEGIKPGESYYAWTPGFRGATLRQHTSHGYPRASQLTQSKLGQIYSAAEALEDFGDSGASPDEESLQTLLDDAVAAIDDARNEAESVMGEYEEAIEAMPASEEQNQERIDAIEEWIGELESAQSEIESIDLAEALEEDDPVGHVLDQVQGYLSDAAGAFSL